MVSGAVLSASPVLLGCLVLTPTLEERDHGYLHFTDGKLGLGDFE